MAEVDESEQRARMNRMYRAVLPFYDVTRRYWLLGREHAIESLLAEPWGSLIEVGVGTGRNLNQLRKKRPEALYGGVDISDAMLGQARKRCPWAQFCQGAAESVDLNAVLGQPPQRILFSYSVSMFHRPEAAIGNARRALAPNGQVILADFGPMQRWPTPARGALRRFLDYFHVFELDHDALRREATQWREGAGGFWSVLRFGPELPRN